MSKTIDCLIIGHYEMDFEDYDKTLKKLGDGSGAYRNISLSSIRIDGKPRTADEVFNRYLCAPGAGPNAMKPIRTGETFSCTIACLATYLNKNGLTFDYINAFREEQDALSAKLKEENILTIAITTTMYGSAFPILEIINFIKKYNRTAKIIVGGPYIYGQYCTQEKMVLEYLLSAIPNVDFFVFNNQGETTLVNIINALKNNQPLDKVKNLYYKTPSGYKFTPFEKEENSLSDNITNWNLFARSLGEFVNIRTSTSCPFSCGFCSFPKNAGKFQTSTADAVEQELDMLKKIGSIKRVQVIDDTFNMPVNRFKDILKRMIKNNYGFKWHCHMRCQFMDEESAQLMKESGCEGVFLGIESGNAQQLINMNKLVDLDKYQMGLGWLKKYEIPILGSFFIGYPGETQESVQQTIKLIEDTEMDFYQVQLWYCDPIAPVWEKRNEFKLKGSHFEWTHATMDSKTAAALVEQMFLTVKKSVCVPRYNFDFDHLFHLRQRGMSLEQVKAFFRIFNEALAEKLMSPTQRDVRNEIIEKFKALGREINNK